MTHIYGITVTIDEVNRCFERVGKIQCPIEIKIETKPGFWNLSLFSHKKNKLQDVKFCQAKKIFSHVAPAF